MHEGGAWIYGMMFLAGVAIPVMAAMSGQIGLQVGAPTAAVAIFTIAAVVGTLFAQFNGGLRFNLIGDVAIPTMTGGAIIAFYLLSISMLGPKIGLGTAILLVIGGQIASSVAIDTFGLFGALRVPYSPMRILGIALVVIGVILARRPVL